MEVRDTRHQRDVEFVVYNCLCIDKMQVDMDHEEHYHRVKAIQENLCSNTNQIRLSNTRTKYLQSGSSQKANA